MGGSMLGFVLVSAAILQTLRQSRTNLVSGLVFLLGLTVAYFLLKRHRQSSS
jgi:hypothetical protein